MKEKISIIIPNLDQADKLESCLATLTNQLPRNNSVVIYVVDNGSNDSSLDVIRKYKIKLVEYNEIKNPYAARNFCATKISGDFINFIDSKCLPASDYITSLLDLVSEGPDLVGGHFDFIDLDSNSSIFEIAFAVLYLKINPIYYNGMSSALTGNMIVKTSVFDSLEGFKLKRSGSDVEFVNRARDAGFVVKYGAKLICRYKTPSYKGLISSLKRNENDNIAKSIKSVRPPNNRFLNVRLKELNISLGTTKKLRLLLFLWYTRFLAFYWSQKDNSL